MLSDVMRMLSAWTNQMSWDVVRICLYSGNNRLRVFTQIDFLIRQIGNKEKHKILSNFISLYCLCY